MSLDSLLSAIDSEISRLQQARELLGGIAPRTGKPARHLKSPSKLRSKRVMSAAARKRIGDAQRRRWAAQKAAK